MTSSIAFLRALKGAPLSVLVALAMFGRSGTSALEIATGYNTEAVAKALRALAGMGYVENLGRYNGWRLTSAAVQLPLFTPTQLESEVGKTDLEVGKTDFPQGSGGGGLSDTRALTSNLLTTTTTTWEVGKTDLEVGKTDFPQNGRRNGTNGNGCHVDNLADASNVPPDSETARIAELLVIRAQCSRKRAQTAVGIALAAGACLPEIEIEIIRWLGWLEDPKASKQGFVNLPAYIAKKVERREPAPRGHVKTWSEDEYRIAKLQRDLHPENYTDEAADLVEEQE